ncbi:MAG: V-type ATP synthase subunit E [Clostridiales bacterium]|uniref:V-type ATP synthase subunit E n=1 Tax=Clostridium sp. N3C TaxID=1776758 RepID=UPI00092E07BF|nr:V-type ATP synthase subunit E [Clostridium sp. N3C]NLZ49678.1 V-type ATP synthase subunit E [Clostridiales bacterium]SCN21655.1 V-type ATP synthase subunit E [Clostridium sp. N3C]
MSDINVIINKIIKDAENERDAILKEAKDEEASIVSKSVAKAESEKAAMIEKAKKDAAIKKERIISSATIEVRNKKLAAKQQVISKVFNQALEKMKALPKEQYVNFVKNSLVALDLKGDEKIRISKKDADIIDQALLDEVNKILSSEGKKANLKLSSEHGDFAGGFIVEKGKIDLNYTFEALLDLAKDNLEHEVANILFG